MKTYTLYFILTIGLLVCGFRAAVAQELSLSSPIVMQLSKIDSYGVRVWFPSKFTERARLGLVYRDMKQSEVDQIVKSGVILNRPVWVMDGDKVIAKCKLQGEFVLKSDSESKAEYGLCLAVDSAEEAQKIGARLRLEPSLDELIQKHKKQLDDERFWIF